MIGKDPLYKSIIIGQGSIKGFVSFFSELDKFEKICFEQIFSNLSNFEKTPNCLIIMEL